MRRRRRRATPNLPRLVENDAVILSPLANEDRKEAFGTSFQPELSRVCRLPFG